MYRGEPREIRAEIISQVQRLADIFERTPTLVEFNMDPRTVSSSTVTKYFGSWNNLIESAGLGINKTERRVTDELLIEQVRSLADDLKRSPTLFEFTQVAMISCADTIRKHFGSWNNFLEAAELELNREARK